MPLDNSHHWTTPVNVATTESISLFGFQTIDGIELKRGDRVLVKDQAVSAENGLYVVSEKDWSRAPDYDTESKIHRATTFVRVGGEKNGGYSFIQENEVQHVGTDSLNFGTFSSSTVSAAGDGLDLSEAGNISLVINDGLIFKDGALAVNLESVGGLTINDGQIALDEVGTAGTYSVVETNSKGQVVSGSNPTTLEGYGIIDALPVTGGELTGALDFEGGTHIAVAPTPGTAWISTAPYGTGQGDGRTHFGLNNNGVLTNYLRGEVTRVDSSLHVIGAGTYASTLRVGTGAKVGYVTAKAGNATQTGRVDFFTGAEATAGYIVSNDINQLTFGSGKGWNWSFDQTPLVGTSQVLHAGNFNSFAAPLDGRGAIGRWNINITGVAQSATTVAWAGIVGKPASQTWTSADGSALVAGQLAWKSFGDGGTIFDTSGGSTPSGIEIPRTNSTLPWKVGAPTLMGWNGTDTIGVRVDSARLSSLTEQRTFANIRTDGVNRGEIGSVSIAGKNKGFAGIDFTAVNATFALNDVFSGVYRNSSWDWRWTEGVLTAGAIPADRITGEVPRSKAANVANSVLVDLDKSMTFTTVIKADQPAYVLGSTDLTTTDLYDPAALKVAYAVTAGTAENTVSISAATNKAYTWSGAQQFVTNKGDASYIGTDNVGYGTQFTSTDGGAAGISFQRVGLYGLNMGLDPDNVFRIGGWSAPQSRLQLDTHGNLTAAGKITEYSDARLKSDIKVIGNSLEKLKSLFGVTYTRIDSGERGTGVIAQDVQRVLPEAVQEDADGKLSVAYGNMIGLLIEAIKELNTEINSLKTQLAAKGE